MKQHITKKQWDELDDKQKKNLMSIYNVNDLIDEWEIWIPINIGQMIEFLGKKFMEISNSAIDGWRIKVNPEWNKIHKDRELVNALWKAVKEKL